MSIMDLPLLITFGSQIARLDPEYLSAIRSLLLQMNHSDILINAIGELPSVWEAFSKALPTAHKFLGRQILDQLQQWIQNDRPIDFSELAPNTLLAPLTLLSQLFEYLQYLQTNKLNHGLITAAVQSGGFQGLCIGFLSAICLSNSENERELMQTFGTALRIAALVEPSSTSMVFLPIHQNIQRASLLPLRILLALMTLIHF